MTNCEHCKYALWDYDDAYGATVRWVEGCKLIENGQKCIFDKTEKQI